jgi:hypothetical protein
MITHSPVLHNPLFKLPWGQLLAGSVRIALKESDDGGYFQLNPSVRISAHLSFHADLIPTIPVSVVGRATSRIDPNNHQIADISPNE